jgi:hypothetical protein
MPAIIYWIVVIIVALIVYATMPRPKSATPPTLQDIDVPTAEDGREVIDGGGTFWINDPNVVWYGDLDTSPVYSKGGGK